MGVHLVWAVPGLIFICWRLAEAVAEHHQVFLRDD
jgi:hypothetical protein